MGYKFAALVVVVSCLTGPVLAQSLPQPVQNQIDEVNAACREFGGQAAPQQGFLTSADLNGDGQPDYIVDLMYQNCAGAMSAFCGSAGCPVTVWLSGPGGYFVASGGHVQQWQIEGSSIRSFVHGQMCNPPRSGADGCEQVQDFRGMTQPR